MTNLRLETLDVLRNAGKEPKDVKFVCRYDEKLHWYCTWDEFVAVIGDANYDAGYGTAEIARNLLVVGNNWWLERHEYDGSEWWEYKERPVKPKDHKVPEHQDIFDQ